jgi:hypothetical protein
MNLNTYLLGSFYIMNSIFRFSDYITNSLFTNKIINLDIQKYDKINESIYSSIHAFLVSLFASLSMNNSLLEYNIKEENDNKLQYLTVGLCMSYFIIDLFKCLYHKKYLFILHHIAAINLLTTTIYSFQNKNNKGFYSMHMIFLLESNTILLNLGFLLKEFKFHYSIICTSWIIHLLLFVLFRLVTLPRIIFIYYYNEKLNIETLSKLPSIALILTGSSYWAYRQFIGIKKYLKENSVI